ncbi:hypothetical protein AAFM48_16940 [Burkholderia pseudomallei]
MLKAAVVPRSMQKLTEVATAHKSKSIEWQREPHQQLYRIAASNGLAKLDTV